MIDCAFVKTHFLHRSLIEKAHVIEFYLVTRPDDLQQWKPQKVREEWREKVSLLSIVAYRTLIVVCRGHCHSSLPHKPDGPFCWILLKVGSYTFSLSRLLI